MTTNILPYIDLFGNPVIFYSLHMIEPLENTFINPLVTPHNFLIHAFKTLSILLIPNKTLNVSICTALILALFSFHIIVLLPYIRAGMSNVFFKTLEHSSYKPLELTRDLIAPTTLQLTNFLKHSASSVPDSPKTHPIYLNSNICSNHIPSIKTSKILKIVLYITYYLP